MILELEKRLFVLNQEEGEESVEPGVEGGAETTEGTEGVEEGGETFEGEGEENVSQE